MDDSFFTLEPPASYTVTAQEVKTDTSPPDEKDLIDMFREYSELNARRSQTRSTISRRRQSLGSRSVVG